MSKRKGVSTMNSNDIDNDLTAEELTTFNPLVSLEIPERMKNGKPGVVFIRELPALDVIDLLTNKGENERWLFDLMSLAIVRRDGSPMFHPGEVKTLRDTSFSIFNRLQSKVLELNPINAGGVNPLETSQSSDSPTN